MHDRFIEAFISILDRFWLSLFHILPNLILAFLIFLIGLLLARVIRTLSERFITNLDRIIPNRNVQVRLHRFMSEIPVSRVTSSILYWIIIFFFLIVSAETLGLPVVSAWMSGIADYLPNILAATLIGFAGIIGGVIVRDIITTASSSAGIVYGEILGRLAQIIIILISILISIEQIGIDVAFLTNLVIIIIGALLFGASLAFGRGAQTSVSNILASYYLQKTYKAGHTVKIGDIKGRIAQITPVAVILDTPDGQVCVPAKEFSEVASVLLKEEQ